MCEINLHGDYVDAYNEKERKARKGHVCVCCGGSINAGERYVYRSYIYDGEPGSEKCCAACEADVKEFGDARGVGLMPHAAQEHMDECIAEQEPGWEKWQAVVERMEQRRAARELSLPKEG